MHFARRVDDDERSSRAKRLETRVRTLSPGRESGSRVEATSVVADHRVLSFRGERSSFMSDAERAGLLHDGETSNATSRGSKWAHVRRRGAVALGVGACLLVAGVSVRDKARASEPTLGYEDIDKVKRETIDARLKSVFGIDLHGFAELVRDENDIEYAGKELFEKKKQFRALADEERAWNRHRAEMSGGDDIAQLSKKETENDKAGAHPPEQHSRNDRGGAAEPILGSPNECEDEVEMEEESAPIMPVYFHTEKSGGTSLVLHALELMNSDRPETLSIIDRVRNEDVMLDKELRDARSLCPGSALFLTTVWKAGTVWEPGRPRPLEDASDENWRDCRLLTSHTGRELMRRADEAQRQGAAPTRPKILMGMFRDPAEYEQAAWRSEVFMYHDLRAKLGWGKLVQTPLGSALTEEELKDFGPDSKFAKIMLEDHCKGRLDTNFQTKKLLEDKWFAVKDDHASARKMALARVRELDWIGLTHRFNEGACMLAFALRRKPLSTSDSNYDRRKLLPDTLKANHPHSDDHSEGTMDPELKKKLYECNDLDTAVFKLAETEFEERKSKMLDVLREAKVSNNKLEPIRGGGKQQMLDPQPYLDCMHQASSR